MFAKKPKQTKILRVITQRTGWCQFKMWLVFQTLTMLNILCFGCFAAGQHVHGFFSFVSCNIYKRLVSVSTDKTSHWIVLSTFNFRKKCTFRRFSFFRNALFICIHRNRSLNLTFRTTGVENTCQMITAISFKVGVNKSSKIFVIVSIREKYGRVPCISSIP